MQSYTVILDSTQRRVEPKNLIKINSNLLLKTLKSPLQPRKRHKKKTTLSLKQKSQRKNQLETSVISQKITPAA